MSFQITFKGRLGADPDISVASNGSQVAKMRVVTNGRRMVDGNWEDTDTSWWSVTAFGRTAEAAPQLRKGDLVMVVGKIKQREWEKDGVKRTTADVVADDLGRVLRADQPPVTPAATGSPWDDGAPF